MIRKTIHRLVAQRRIHPGFEIEDKQLARGFIGFWFHGGTGEHEISS
jgi:hypothetical protein